MSSRNAPGSVLYTEIKELVSKTEVELMIENAILKSQSQPVSRSLNKSQNKIETKIINKIRRTKKSAVMSEISKLMPSLSIPEIQTIIVNEKGLCSKASFYRYIASLNKSQKIETETNLRQINFSEVEK